MLKENNPHPCLINSLFNECSPADLHLFNMAAMLACHPEANEVFMFQHLYLSLSSTEADGSCHFCLRDGLPIMHQDRDEMTDNLQRAADGRTKCLRSIPMFSTLPVHTPRDTYQYYTAEKKYSKATLSILVKLT